MLVVVPHLFAYYENFHDRVSLGLHNGDRPLNFEGQVSEQLSRIEQPSSLEAAPPSHLVQAILRKVEALS